jgi:hypothetical protein
MRLRSANLLPFVLLFSLSLGLPLSLSARAAGEIDSHQVWGSGLFGMHVPDQGVSIAQPGEGNGVYRDQYGALHDADQEMTPSDTAGAQTVNPAPLNLTNAPLSKLFTPPPQGNTPAPATALPENTNLGGGTPGLQTALPIQSTYGYLAPMNTWTGSASSPANQGYTGGYGQYGPDNNLDLLRAGPTSQYRMPGGIGSRNLFGTVSNFQNQLFPGRSVTGKPVFTPGGVATQNVAPMTANRPVAPGEIPIQPLPVPPMRVLPMSSATPVNAMAAPRRHTRVASAIPMRRRDESITGMIGPVNGVIEYADHTVTLFGTDGALKETPQNLVYVKGRTNHGTLFDRHAVLRRQIAGIERRMF